jgi:L-aspartate oxidase
VWRHLGDGHRVFLDARAALGSAFAEHFPAIAAACAAAGVDPARQPIPVRPAAHYHMGGIAVDLQGRSTLPGLWACGEVAGTGLHGANRLASNSLLEAVVCAEWVAGSVAAAPRGCSVAGAPRGCDRPQRHAAVPVASDPALIRPILSAAAGVLREHDGLADGIASLLPLACSVGPAADPALVAMLIAVAALRRRESRGGHFRSDFPEPDEAVRRRSALTLQAAFQVAQHVTGRVPCAISA